MHILLLTIVQSIFELLVGLSLMTVIGTLRGLIGPIDH
jgi:hypothetical protein